MVLQQWQLLELFADACRQEGKDIQAAEFETTKTMLEIYPGRDAALFQSSRAALYAAGEPLLERAQQSRVVRADTHLSEVIQMVGGIAKISALDPAQVEHILAVALDGLRYRPPNP